MIFKFVRTCLPNLAYVKFLPNRYFGCDSSPELTGMELRDVMKKLNEFAKKNCSASWDNVGLLVEPSAPHPVNHILLTNDLTVPVLEEALELKTNMIVSYHPPIFKPLKSLNQGNYKSRIILKCIENKIAVYSPHTILDNMTNGLTDWLISPFVGKVTPIRCELVDEQCYQVSVTFKEVSVNVKKTIQGLVEETDVKSLGSVTVNTDSGTMIEQRFKCKNSELSRVMATLTPITAPDTTVQVSQHRNVCVLTFPHQLHIHSVVEGYCGEGRLVTLDSPVKLQQAVEMCKTHLKLDKIRLAKAVGKSLDSSIRSVAVCAGSGGSVLGGVRADLYLTGEMSHHELLDATHNGSSVILTDHSNTERGYLTPLSNTISQMLDNKVTVQVSSADRDPLEVV